MNNNIDDDTDSDDIRPPDNTKIEQLIDSDSFSFFSSSYTTNDNFVEEQDISEAILHSIQDWKELQKINDEYEKKVIENYNNIRLERENMFQPFLVRLKKISKYDKNLGEIVEIIENIIENYCLGYMDTCELDHETRSKIFNEISNIRAEKKAIDLLKSIIQEKS